MSRSGDHDGPAAEWRDPVLFAVVVLGALVRIPPAFGDPWLDEVWSITEAADLRSLAEVFTGFPHSNNHHLNTLVAYLLGAGAHPVLYRLHSLAAGIASVALAWDIGRFRGRSAAAIAGMLTATSYILIHFSSEARGYALLVFFALATRDAAWRFGRALGWRPAVAVWVCTPLGFLSHLTYLYVFVATALWLVIHLRRRCPRARDALRHALRCFGVPLATLAVLYVLVLRHVVIGAADPYTLRSILVRTLSYAAGGPGGGVGAAIVAVVGGGALLAAIGWLRRAGGDDWLFYALVTIVVPAAVLLVLRPEVLAVQYFITSIAFALVAVSVPAAALWDRGGRAAACVAAMLVLYVAGNGVNVSRLLRDGRGGIGKACSTWRRARRGRSSPSPATTTFATA